MSMLCLQLREISYCSVSILAWGVDICFIKWYKTNSPKALGNQVRGDNLPWHEGKYWLGNNAKVRNPHLETRDTHSQQRHRMPRQEGETTEDRFGKRHIYTIIYYCMIHDNNNDIKTSQITVWVTDTMSSKAIDLNCLFDVLQPTSQPTWLKALWKPDGKNVLNGFKLEN